MTKIVLTLFFSTAFLVSLAQDEGTVVKKERIQLDKGIFLNGGVSIAGGSNLGDYSSGINFEGGYMVRLNRVVSVGGSISYLSFKYDQTILKNGVTSPDWYYDTQSSATNDGYYLTLAGGDVSIISVAANFKFNFVPVKDNSVVSVYAFAKPFIASASLSEISGLAEYYDTNGNPDATFNASATYPAKSSISGGIYLGPGVEFYPAKSISFFAQASFGYTFPIDMVSTRSYGNDYNIDLADPNFPTKSLGFTSINFAAGISFNLD